MFNVYLLSDVVVKEYLLKSQWLESSKIFTNQDIPVTDSSIGDYPPLPTPNSRFLWILRIVDLLFLLFQGMPNPLINS